MILLDPDARPIIGHRGASGEYPENTLLAFDRAIEQGADALEFDVRATRDGVPVVIHDATVDRTTDGKGTVADLVVDALRRLDAGCGEHVPRLDEVLAQFHTTPLIIELKEARVAPAAADLIREAGAESRILVGSFERAALRPFESALYLRAAARGETLRWWLTSRLGLANRHTPYGAFTVPERHSGVTVVDRRFVGAARRSGLPVHVWTVNDPADARRLRAIGVAGLITNYPARLRASLE